jgi:hypothetical protein
VICRTEPIYDPLIIPWDISFVSITCNEGICGIDHEGRLQCIGLKASSIDDEPLGADYVSIASNYQFGNGACAVVSTGEGICWGYGLASHLFLHYLC